MKRTTFVLILLLSLQSTFSFSQSAPVMIYGQALMKSTGEPVGNVEVKVINEDGSIREKLKTLSNGNYRLSPLTLGKKYQLVFSGKEFLEQFMELDFSNSGAASSENPTVEWQVDVSMVALEKDKDYSALKDLPTAKITLNKETGMLEFDTFITIQYSKALSEILPENEKNTEVKNPDAPAEEVSIHKVDGDSKLKKKGNDKSLYFIFSGAFTILIIALAVRNRKRRKSS